MQTKDFLIEFSPDALNSGTPVIVQKDLNGFEKIHFIDQIRKLFVEDKPYYLGYCKTLNQLCIWNKKGEPLDELGNTSALYTPYQLLILPTE